MWYQLERRDPLVMLVRLERRDQLVAPDQLEDDEQTQEGKKEGAYLKEYQKARPYAAEQH